MVFIILVVSKSGRVLGGASPLGRQVRIEIHGHILHLLGAAPGQVGERLPLRRLQGAPIRYIISDKALDGAIVRIVETFLFNSEHAASDLFGSNSDLGFLLVLLGITNTIVVYRDVPDFLWSVALVVVPFATLVTQSLLIPENVPSDYNIFWETTQTKLVSVIGGLITTHAILKTFINCVSNNGIIIGPVMFIFKICASIVSIFVCMAVFNKLFENQK